MKITPSDSVYQRTLLEKFWFPIWKIRNFLFFAQRKMMDEYLFVFSQDDIYPTVRKNVERAHLNENYNSSVLYKRPKRLEENQAHPKYGIAVCSA